jgi:pilus assembly protein Flp/PilA
VFLATARNAAAFAREWLRVRTATPPIEGPNIMRNLIWTFVRDEQGATAIEYGLLAAGIAGAIIAVVASVGTSLNSTFSSISSQLN